MKVELTLSFCEECGGEISFLPGVVGSPSLYGGGSNGWGHTGGGPFDHQARPIRAFPDRSSPTEVEEWLDA